MKDGFKEIIFIVSFKGGLSSHHFVHEDTQSPPVHGGTVFQLLEDLAQKKRLGWRDKWGSCLSCTFAVWTWYSNAPVPKQDCITHWFQWQQAGFLTHAICTSTAKCQWDVVLRSTESLSVPWVNDYACEQKSCISSQAVSSRSHYRGKKITDTKQTGGKCETFPCLYLEQNKLNQLLMLHRDHLRDLFLSFR